MRELIHKRGDTFTIGVKWIDDNTETPVDLTPYTIASQIRDARDALVAELDVAPADQTTNRGELTLSADAAVTATWSIGRHVCDVEFRLDDVVVSSETFAITIIKDVTR